MGSQRPRERNAEGNTKTIRLTFLPADNLSDATIWYEEHRCCYGLTNVLAKFMLKPYPPSVMIFGDGASGRSLSFDAVMSLGSSRWDEWPSKKKRREAAEYKEAHGDAVSRRPGTGLSPGTKPAGTLTSDFPASRTGRNICLLFKPPSPRYLLRPLGQLTQVPESAGSSEPDFTQLGDPGRVIGFFLSTILWIN